MLAVASNLIVRNIDPAIAQALKEAAAAHGRSAEAEHREILLLREIEDMSYDDIAAVLDISLGTVKSRIARARAGLLEKMPR